MIDFKNMSEEEKARRRARAYEGRTEVARVAMTSKKQDKINAARIQRAIFGLQIPMMQIQKIYKTLEQLVANGASDEELAASAKNLVEG